MLLAACGGCAGWACLAVDGVAIEAGGDVIHPEGARPAVSSDGDRAIWTSAGDFCVDGGGFRTVLAPTDGPGGAAQNALHSPDYAPDGSIVFEADWTGERIWRLPAGGAPAVLGDFADDNTPCVLSDGTVISLWLGRAGATGHELKRMAADAASYDMLEIDVDVVDVGIGCGG